MSSLRHPAPTSITLVLFILVLSWATLAHGIQVVDVPISTHSGYGYVDVHADGPCLTPAQRQAIIIDLQAARSELVARGVLPLFPDPDRTVALQWPLVVPADHLLDPGVHGISGFVDQDPNYPNQLLDWNCGERTYDLSSGYNHQGTDVFTWPFAWHKMDNDDVEIVAGAPGVIISKIDGYFDRSCGFGGGSWNAVYIEHIDGSVAWYGHMKRFSLTTKAVGETVVAGEFLGIVGSSGNSTGPHLHLEIHDTDWQLIDPYAGPCNSLNSESWWAEQPPYFDSAINALRTHSLPPDFQECPNPAITNEENHFEGGETVYFVTYYRDQLAGQVSQYEVLRPDGSHWRNWTNSMSSPPFYAASYWYWSWPLPAEPQEGWWTFRVTFEGVMVEHQFLVGDPTATPNEIPNLELVLHDPQPNPFNPTTSIRFNLPSAGNITLTVHDLQGRHVATLTRGLHAAGPHSVSWRGDRDDGSSVASGIYLVRLSAGSEHRSQRLTLVK